MSSETPITQENAIANPDAAPAAPAATQHTEPVPAGQAAPQQGQDTGQDDESFAELFAAQSTPGAHLSPGQRVTVTVVAVTADTIFVSTGSKVDGIVERAELETEGATPVAVGDQLDLYVTTVSAQEVRLSKMMRGAGGLAALEEARDSRLPIEGKVQAQVKGGFAVEVMKRRAFCPMGQMDLRSVEDPEAFIGKTFPFVITKLEKAGRNIVLSRRILLEGEQAENRDAFLATVSIGDTIEGRIVRLAPFGAFVELAPGVEGLIHLSELSWSRVAQADEAVAMGEQVRVKILAIATSEKGPRISLSIRQVSDDPWSNIGDRLKEGELVTGKVVRNAAFGSFVEVLPGIDGLIHVSELSYEKHVRKPEDVLSVGESVTVKVKVLDLEKKRLSLSLRDVGGDPWESVPEEFPLDQEVTGTVEKRAVFGVFITLRPGITGLLPASTLSGARNKNGLDKAQPGDQVQVIVREIDVKARKVTLGIPGNEADPAAPMSRSEEKDWKRHAPKPAAQGSFGGTLGLALQQASLKKKK